MASNSGGKNGWQLLNIVNLRWLWSAQTISQIGEGLNMIWLVYTLTGSALKTTVIGILQTLPPLLFGPLLGVYVDRLPKKWLMMAVDLMRAGLVIIIPILHSLNALTLPRLYAVVLVMALVSTVFTPSLEAVIPSIVESGQLTGANALINSTAMIGLLVGPALSGIGIATIGLEKVLYVSAVMFVLSVFTLGRLKIKGDAHPRAAAKQDGFLGAFKKGLHFVLVQRRTVAAFVMTALCYSLAASAFVFLLPVYAEKSLHVGAIILGWLWSSYGAGMVVVSASLAFLKECSASTRLLIIIVAMVVGGIASFLLASTTFAPAAIGLVALVGAGLASFSPIVWGLLQEMTPDALRGRVFGIFNTGAMAASMIGMVAFGWATDRMGAQASLIGMTAIFGITAVSLILLRQFGDLRPSHAAAKKSG